MDSLPLRTPAPTTAVAPTTPCRLCHGTGWQAFVR
jgi:hypothetical protein